MKVLKATFTNGTFSTTRSFKIENKSSDGIYFGTLLKWMFRASDTYRKVSKGAPKATEISHVKLECNGFKFDSNTIEAGLTDKFKFGNTAKSKRNFADNLWTVYKFVTDDMAPEEFKNVQAELTAEVASN
jgi:hypothetical protein